MSDRARRLVHPAFSLYVPKPGHPAWDALFAEAATLAVRIGKVMVRGTLADRARRARRRVLAITKTLKNVVRNKIKMARNDHDFVPLFYIWTMTNACNFNCSYCSNHRDGTYPALFKQGGKHKQNLSTSQGERLLDVMREASAIYFCGGEPTLRADLPELLAHSSRLSMFNMINTNGSLLGDLLVQPRYRSFLSLMDVVIVSLDSLDVRKQAGMYETSEAISAGVIRNLLALRILQQHVPFKLVANTVITRDTVADAMDILDFCNDLGITFSPVSANIGNAADPVLAADPAYQALVDRILDRARQGFPMIASPALLERVLRCRVSKCYPVVFDHVDHDGSIYWPCKAYPGAVKVNVLRHASVIDAHRVASRAIDPAFFHGKGRGRCNGACQWMQNCVTEFYGEALRVGFIEGGLFKEIRGLIS